MKTDRPRGRSGAEVLKFLDDHRLDHDPDHYAFAHRYLFAGDTVFAQEVAGIIDGGIRITPSQVLQLLPSASPDTGDGQDRSLDRLTMRFLDIVGDTLAATGTLNRELVAASSSLLGAEVPSVRAVIAAMIERTTKAEAQLAEATAQAQRLRDELNATRDEASRDQLTGLANRSATEERLLAMLAREEGCCLALIDVDHMKAINGLHGDGVGDRVLKAVATTLRETCTLHHVGRWSGQAFVVLVQKGDLTAAAAAIEQAQGAIRQREMKLRETDEPLGRITVSAGLASSRGRSAEQLIAAAAGLLGQAKARGRDRTFVEATLVRV